MNGKDLYCLGLHFKYLFEQGINNKPFNFAEPCEKCKYFAECKGEWLAMKMALKEATGISVIAIVQQ